MGASAVSVGGTVGGGGEHTSTRAAVLASRGYPPEVIAGAAGNGNADHLEVDGAKLVARGRR